MSQKIIRLFLLAVFSTACGLFSVNGIDSEPPSNRANEQNEITVIEVATSPADLEATEATQPLIDPIQSEMPNDDPLITIECTAGLGLDFSGQTQSQPTYANKNFRCANFSGTNLSQPDFAFSDLSGASFANAILSQPDILDTVFMGTDFNGAIIVGAEIANSDFTGADLRNAQLVDLEWLNTICPDGQNSDVQGGTCLGNLDPISVSVGGQPSASTPSDTDIQSTQIVDLTSSLPLSDEWYQDSDGNAIPDFIEIQMGYDPLIDDCAPATCTAEIVEKESFMIQGENVLVILDASGSMAQSMGGQTRMEAAKEVLTNYVAALPSTAKMGLMVYGHRGDNTEAGKAVSCAGVELFAPVGQVSAESFPDLLNSFSPNGWTPIAGALNAAEQAFMEVEGGVKKVVLVTDGLETCGGDPVSTAAQLNLNPTIKLVIDVVGFSISDAGDRNALMKIAEAGGGVYHDVQSRDDFNNYIKNVVDIAHARANYAACVGQEVILTNLCYSQLLLAANLTITERILELANDTGTDHEAEISALEALQVAIGIAEEQRTEQYLEWELEHMSILEEMEALDNVYDELFPGP